MTKSTTSSLRIQQKEQYQYQVLNKAQISSEGLPRVGNDGIGSEKKTYSTEVEFVHAVSAGGSVKFLPAV